MKVAAHGIMHSLAWPDRFFPFSFNGKSGLATPDYHAGKAWLYICVGVEPPFSKSWVRHCECFES